MGVGASDVLAIASGSLVGFILGLIGGGGSILAVPLLIYVVGVKSPHVAIGTGAIVVAVSAFANLIDHARRGHVCWPAALWFAASGVGGAAIGSTLGKNTDGQKLLTMFGVLMIVVAVAMARRSSVEAPKTTKVHEGKVPYLLVTGAVVGMLSGFFGIGGGFLVVPGLLAATAMPLIMAIGSSLVSVTAFGMSTAVNYAASGLIDWRLAALFVGGAVIGGLAACRFATVLAPQKRTLSLLYAGVVACVGLYVAIKGVVSLAG
jgi:uncharacterized membrane protein YfcA